jgi:hypothetical protein
MHKASLAGMYNQYVRNLNKRYGSETRAKMIISDLEKWDMSVSPRSGTASVESKE